MGLETEGEGVPSYLQANMLAELAELTIRVWMNLVYLPSLMHHFAVKLKKLGAIIWLSSQVGGSCGLIVRLFVIWMDDTDGGSDSILKHKPIWAYNRKSQRKNKSKTVQKKQGDMHRTYGTRVVPVFVLSLADVDPHLMMDDESLMWTSNDVVIVLQHQSEKIPLSYVSETERMYVVLSQVQRHIVVGLAAAVVGGLSAPYEKASHIHERLVVNWLLAGGCHPFGPFSNASQISQLLQDVPFETFSKKI